MNSCFTKVTILLVAIIFATSGCNSESKNVGCPSRATNVSFTKTQNISIKVDCLLKQYTQASTVQIKPQQCIFKITNNHLELKTDASLTDELRTLLSYSILYSSRTNSFPYETVQQGKKLTIDDKNYAVIEETVKINGKEKAKIRFYCQLDNLLVDRLEIENERTGEIISSLCYDFTYVDNSPTSFATKIDIFSGSAANFDKVKIKEFEFLNFKVLSN